MSKRAVLNLNARLHQIAYGYHQPPGEGSSLTVKQVDLQPGLNVLDESVWEQVKNQPMAKLQMSEGHIKEGPLLADGINPFANLSPRAAIKAVLDTFDTKLLEKVVRVEQREPVVEAVQYQREKVEAEAKGLDVPEAPSVVKNVNDVDDRAPKAAARKGKK